MISIFDWEVNVPLRLSDESLLTVACMLYIEKLVELLRELI